mmetsp:Transcript_10439/g.30672  ORF Transcript_10439/g.30672 Transcript_10439/m.30672 type:complete len:322 (-) Transcript_10439:187-1152(-)
MPHGGGGGGAHAPRHRARRPLARVVRRAGVDALTHPLARAAVRRPPPHLLHSCARARLPARRALDAPEGKAARRAGVQLPRLQQCSRPLHRRRREFTPLVLVPTGSQTDRRRRPTDPVPHNGAGVRGAEAARRRVEAVGGDVRPCEVGRALQIEWCKGVVVGEAGEVVLLAKRLKSVLRPRVRALVGGQVGLLFVRRVLHLPREVRGRAELADREEDQRGRRRQREELPDEQFGLDKVEEARHRAKLEKDEVRARRQQPVHALPELLRRSRVDCSVVELVLGVRPGLVDDSQRVHPHALSLEAWCHAASVLLLQAASVGCD